MPPIGEEQPRDQLTPRDLFNPQATGRVILLWLFTPTISAVASFALFSTLL